MKNSNISKYAEAVIMIDRFLTENQLNDHYFKWLEKYALPKQLSNEFFFEKLVQAMFSGGMNGKIVDHYMPLMKKEFHNWDIDWIKNLDKFKLEKLSNSTNVISNKSKIYGIVYNAHIFSEIINTYGSFAKYLNYFASNEVLKNNLIKKFKFIGKITAEDFLRNIGYDRIKPDRHILRWLERVDSTFKVNNLQKINEFIKEVCIKADIPKYKFDSAIYLFCADRNDVLKHKGICSINPKCSLCPINSLCDFNNTVKNTTQEEALFMKEKPKKNSSNTFNNTVWDIAYHGLSLEEIKNKNPFAIESWLKQPFYGKANKPRDRKEDIIHLFNNKNFVKESRIREFGRNKGTYVAFRAIAHNYAIWENGNLKLIKNLKNN